MFDRNQRRCAVFWTSKRLLKLFLCVFLFCASRSAAAQASLEETTRQITFGRWFAEPLRPTRSPTGAENQALLQGLSAFAARSERDDFSGLTTFLTQHPDSVWAMALQTTLGMEYYNTGYYSRAIAAWQRAWHLGKNEADEGPKALAERAGAELAFLFARLGRMNELRELLRELGIHALRGTTAERVNGARHGLWSMENEPEKSFRCGPFALERIRTAFKIENPIHEAILNSKSTTNGFSLVQVEQLAREIGMNYQMAHRSQGAAFIFPAVAHWKSGHYAALIRQRGELFLAQDPTFGNDTWASTRALDDEASGYFLVPAGPLPPGWRAVPRAEAEGIWGKGLTTSSNAKDTTRYDEKAKQCNSGGGMATWNAHLMVVSQQITDTPVGYTPPVGPAVYFTATYNQREANQPALFSYANLSPQWTFNWLSFIIDDPFNRFGSVQYYVDGGGTLDFFNSDVTNQVFHGTVRNPGTLTRTSTNSYELRFPDGSRQVFGFPDGSVSSMRRVFLTQVIDPAGNAATLTYDATNRLTSITDAIGQVTTVHYDLGPQGGVPGTENQHLYKITSVTDPFGRTARFKYAAGPLGSLTNITDMLGLNSGFLEGADTVGDTTHVTHIGRMTTPYGTTFFRTGNIARNRWLEITEPDGGTERIEYAENDRVGIAFAEPFSLVPAGMPTWNRYLYARNTYHWDKKAFAEGYATNDFTKARIYHFTHGRDINAAEGLLESVKMPFENRVWFNYPNQTVPTVPGTDDRPSRIGRVLDDGTTQLRQFEHNPMGNITRSIDPVGRTLTYIYATNDVDLLEVRQTRVGHNELLVQATYDARHLPLSVVDGGGQATFFGYNSRGQLLNVTNVKNEVVSFSYDPSGYLVAVDGPLPGPQDRNTLTYDSSGRMRTATDPEGYTLTFDYDAFDRLLKVTFPDTTWQEITYDRLDASVVRDRLGRETRYTYDNVRQLAAVQDALGRVTRFDWCKCGDLKSVIDALGRATIWRHDIQGRIIGKEYADGSKVAFEYEKTTSRLRQIRDEQNQLTQFSYYVDDSLAEKRCVDAIIPTPAVRFTYDPDFFRMLTMQDTNGTTAFSYHPMGTAGAGQLASIDGPWVNDTITYAYDPLGRVVSLAINNVAIRRTFDSAGRVTQLTNSLGIFDLTWEAGSARLSGMRYPNGQATEYGYHPNSRDRLLQRITHRSPGNAVLSEFTYGYNAQAQVTNWTQLQGGTTQAWAPSYDPADRLLGVAVSQGGTPVQTFNYSYDDANNRTTEQTNGVQRQFVHNVLNQLSSSSNGVSGNVAYQWDAMHRLVGISNGTHRTAFSYDGFSRRTRVVESENGLVTSDNRYLWCGANLCEERDATASIVLKRFFGQGLRAENGSTLPAGNYFFTRDHLRSVREMSDAAGLLRARYAYDPFGHRTRIAGGADSDFGFAGYSVHAPSGLHLALYRAYDDGLGRWLNRDPIGEAGGLNLYAYVFNNPVNLRDPLGLRVPNSFSEWVGLGEDIGSHLIDEWITKKGEGGLCYGAACLGKDGKPQVSVSGEAAVTVNGQKVLQAEGEACVGVKTTGTAKDPLFEYSVKLKLKFLKYVGIDVIDVQGDTGQVTNYKGESRQLNRANNVNPSGEILE
jgi:RHS repeat-associated protein